MSAADRTQAVSGVRIAEAPFDIVELAALRERASQVTAIASTRGIALPAMGRVADAEGTLALCVRPARWLILKAPLNAEARALPWQAALAGVGVAVDLSSGLSAFRLTGPSEAIRSGLARGCRLDLDPRDFPAGHAAATVIAQVPVILAHLADGMLLLTPCSTARHFHEWLGESLR